MDIVSMIDRQHDCVAEEAPPCSSACPLGLDVRDFIKKITTGLYSAAYKVFATHSVLPGIVCHICGEPCKDACVRAETDSPVSLRDLERFCWRDSRDKPAPSLLIPGKNKRLLIVGGGLTGICCAVKLANKGYDVILSGEGGKLGGDIWETDPRRLPREVIDEEFSRLEKISFLHIELGVRYGCEDAELYDAVFVTAKDRFDEYKALQSQSVIFADEQAERAPMNEIRNGIETAFLLEDYIKTGVLRTSRTLSRKCAYRPAPEAIPPVSKKVNPDSDAWTNDDARLEAEHCVLCACENCLGVCPMLNWHHLNAKKLMVNISDTINKHKFNRRTGIRPAMSCVQCGLCVRSCPVQIDLKNLCVETRRVFHRMGCLPSGYYDYWLNDMEHANGESASLFVPSPDGNCRYLYFPGCQIGASDPDYVLASYEWLKEIFPETAMFLHCCGAPAYWAAEVATHEQNLAAIERIWSESGRPVFLLACTTCAEMLKDHLPQIETLSLWRLMADHIDHLRKGEAKTTPVAVFDPCSSKYDPDTQRSIRRLVENAGYEIHELETSGENARCCGYGGLVYSSNPALVEKIAEQNRALGDLEFITYCTNCRDGFARGQKPSRHILDVLFFDESRSVRAQPDLSRRRKNREMLKGVLSGDKREPGIREIAPHERVELFISDEVQKILDNRLITRDDVKRVIHFAETSGRRIYCEDDDTYTAHHVQGKVTFWAQYRPDGSGYRLLNSYLHRMRIEERQGYGG